MDRENKSGLIQKEIIYDALKNSALKFNPFVLAGNPIIFCVEIGAFLTTAYMFYIIFVKTGPESPGFILQISIWLWLTVFFANFAEAIAESRGKAQADTLRKTKKDLTAKKIADENDRKFGMTPASKLVKGDLVFAEAGDVIAGDGEIIKGIASIDESAVTGESAPVIREAGGDRSGVIGGTKVLSDWIVFRITANAGESFLDRMIALVEGAVRKKTPNEIALNILLIFLTIIFLLVTATLQPYARYLGGTTTITQLVSLFVALAPTTIGALLSAIGIAGMNRLLKINVLAFSGRAVEASGDVDVVLLDKTGTITLGNRQADVFMPVNGVSESDLALAAQMSSLSDETPEGRSIVVLAKRKFNIRQHEFGSTDKVHFINFTAETRMSGVDLNNDKIRKGAYDAVIQYLKSTYENPAIPDDLKTIVENIAVHGGTPLVVAKNAQVLGAVYLKDILKGGIKEKLMQLNAMGIKSIMITGDNPLTAASIAAEAGVNDFLSNVTPEIKLANIKAFQKEGHMVAMIGDGTNDAPALAQADVGIAMNTGTAAAREAGNMLDLDSNPTKLIEVVEVGKQILITRGALTTFSIANDVAKYFAIIPAMFMKMFPQLAAINIMRLSTPSSAIMSAIIFNALVIPALIPLALRGVPYKPESASRLLLKNLLIYGLGGIITPFIGIKLIDIIIGLLHIM
jgi:potassium-transporting ATPase ATP-binding subunit